MSIDFYTLAWTIINFLILLFLLKRFLYKPVVAAMEKRQAEVSKRLNDAKVAKEEAVKEKNKYKALVDGFEKERREKLSKVEEDAHILQENRMRDIKKESDEERAKLKKSLARQKEDAERKWRRNWMETLSLQTGKILSALTSESIASPFFNTFLEKLPMTDELKAAADESGAKCVLVSSFDLSDGQKSALAEKLKSFLQRDVTLSFKKTDEETGFMLTCHFYLFRFTFESLLDMMKEDALP